MNGEDKRGTLMASKADATEMVEMTEAKWDKIEVKLDTTKVKWAENNWSWTKAKWTEVKIQTKWAKVKDKIGQNGIRCQLKEQFVKNVVNLAVGKTK